MDGLMCEDIRLGIMVRTRMEQMAREAEAVWRSANPGKPLYFIDWKRRVGISTAMSFSSPLIEIAGGIDRLFAEWELVVG